MAPGDGSCRCAVLGFVAVVSIAVSARAAGTPAQRCASAKQDATGKAAAAMLDCHSSAARRGVAVDSACVAKARTKLASRFADLEARGGCATTHDATGITAIVDSTVGAFVTALRPTTAANRCAAKKLKATGTKAKAKLRCHGKATRVGAVVAADCLAKAEARFTAAFAAAEHSPPCLTTDDADDVESTVDDFVGHVVASVPSETTTTTTSTSTTTTSNPTCLGDGERCVGGNPPCCSPNVCAGFVCGGAATSSCSPCVDDYDAAPGCYSVGCTKDADCCNAGRTCFFCGGATSSGLCALSRPAGCSP